MKKSGIIRIAFALVFALGLMGLVACSGGNASGSASGDSASSSSAAAQTDEEIIKADAEQTLGSLITKDALASAMRASDEAGTLESLGVDIDAFAEAMANKFTFEVTSVEVNGDTAVAKVNMNSPAFNDEAEAMLDEKGSEIMDGLDLEDADISETMAAYMDLLVETIGSPEFPTEVTELDIDYSKQGDEWVMDDYDDIVESLESITESAANL